jgi:hypothetical protein
MKSVYSRCRFWVDTWTRHSKVSDVAVANDPTWKSCKGLLHKVDLNARKRFIQEEVPFKMPTSSCQVHYSVLQATSAGSTFATFQNGSAIWLVRYGRKLYDGLKILCLSARSGIEHALRYASIHCPKPIAARGKCPSASEQSSSPPSGVASVPRLRAEWRYSLPLSQWASTMA